MASSTLPLPSFTNASHPTSRISWEGIGFSLKSTSHLYPRNLLFVMDLSASPTLPALVFRVELEFFLAYPTEHEVNSRHEAKQYPILEALCVWLSDNCGDTAPVELTQHSNHIYKDEWSMRLGNHALEASETEMLPQEHGIHNIALMSPMYWFSDRDETDKWEMKVQHVLKHIHEFAKATNCAVFCNEATGLHVQAGLAAGAGVITVNTAKNLLRTVTAFEHSFDTLHNTPRIQQKNLSCAPPSRFFQNDPEYRRTSPNEWLEMIDAFYSEEDFFGVFNLRRTATDPASRIYCAYHLDNLATARDPRLPENFIEFRQHAGTFEITEISNWVKLCCYLITKSQYGQGSEDRRFMSVCINGIMDHTDCVCPIDILRHLNMPSPVIDYYRWKTSTSNGDKIHPWADDRLALALGENPEGTTFAPLMRRLALRRHDQGRLKNVMAVIRWRARHGEYGMRDKEPAPA